MAKEMGPKVFTRGVTANLARNLTLLTAIWTRQYGIESEYVNTLFALGGLALSHPFEVARVLIVAEEGASHLTGHTM